MNEQHDTIIRDYRPADRDGAYFICLKTGDHGGDGESVFRDDPDALARIYTGPYLEFEPNLALMLEDAEGLCGYVLGALDSRQFYERYEQEWRTNLCDRFPAPSGDSSRWTRVESVHHLYHHPNYYAPEAYEQYPSHLHINLLHRAQRKGHGRRMMDALLSRLRAKGSAGVHLGMSAANERAYQFYLAQGFEELSRHDEMGTGSIYLSRRLN